ncbi:MAG: hypothetical protein ACFB16_13590 [Phormidesmis sp.]
MRRLLLILLATAPLTGCQFLSAGEDVAIPDPFEGAGDTIAETSEVIIESIDTEPAEESTPVAKAPEVPTAVTADLIRSTDPEARTRQVSQSRIDPFAVLPIPLAPEPVAVTASNNTTSRGGNSGGTATTATAKPVSAPTAPPVLARPNNQPVSRPSPIVSLPRIPQPIIAPTISVSGIIQLGGEPYAIVSSGSEPERYVRVGDRLAGGSVRVKRINTMAFEPQVILEENGIEVSRPVGNGGAAEGNAEAAPASGPAEAPAVPSTDGPAEAPFVPPGAVTPLATLPLPADATAAPTRLPAISTPAPSSNALPAPGFVPGSLLLQPPETSSQAILPNLQIAVPRQA